MFNGCSLDMPSACLCEYQRAGVMSKFNASHSSPQQWCVLPVCAVCSERIELLEQLSVSQRLLIPLLFQNSVRRMGWSAAAKLVCKRWSEGTFTNASRKAGWEGKGNTFSSQLPINSVCRKDRTSECEGKRG